MKSKKNRQFKFYFYVSRGVGTGIDVTLLSNNEIQARGILKKLIMPEFSANLKKIEELIESKHYGFC